MGFGGGALIASPWSTAMLDIFGSESMGIAKTFLVHGLGYAVLMSLGWLLVRVPREDWKPQGWTPQAPAADSIVTGGQVSATHAIKTPQFWLLWIVLCFNVTAGIGILEKASPIYQDFFPAPAAAAAALTAAAAGYVAMLSLANMLGRIGWSSLSDKIGRKNIYRTYLGVGALLYLTITLMQDSNKLVFLIATMLILSFYGAGFATVPVYLRDLFGTYQVGAIHGRLLTAWSVAGILGPIMVNAIADSQSAAGKDGPALYTMSFSIMIGLLLLRWCATNSSSRSTRSGMSQANRESAPRNFRRQRDDRPNSRHRVSRLRVDGAQGVHLAGLALGSRSVRLRRLRTDAQGEQAFRVTASAGERYLYLCCGPCSFLYSDLSIRSRRNALSMNLMPVFATAGIPASLWK
jgi:Major Facilitator Superfamily